MTSVTADSSTSMVGDRGPWWLAVVAGALSIVVGVLALANPAPTLLAVGLIFGAYLVIWGVLWLIRAVRADDMSVALRLLAALLAVVAVVAGLVLLVRPGQSVLTAALALGFWFCLTGVLQLVRGITASGGRAWNLLWGLVGIVAGTIILAQPGIGVVTLIWITGFGLIIQGVLEILLGLALRKPPVAPA
jgi:uncharacterized membrane protein HdeD (DUF308 family)